MTATTLTPRALYWSRARNYRTELKTSSESEQEGDPGGREVRSQGQGKNLSKRNCPREGLRSKMIRSPHKKRPAHQWG